MRLRRVHATLAGAALLTLLTGGLTSCGFDKATDRPYTPAAGTNDRTGQVDVLSAVVVAAQPDSGTFIASLVNKSTDEPATFSSLQGASGNAVIVGSISPVSIPPRGFVNLVERGGVTLSGQFTAGDVIPLSLNFASGDIVTMQVPVVTACEEWSGLDHSAEASSSPVASPSATSSSPASSAPAVPATPYNCDSPDGPQG